LLDKRLAQVHRYTIKELTSDFSLLYSLLVLYHRVGKCFELEQLLSFELNTNNSALPPLAEV